LRYANGRRAAALAAIACFACHSGASALVAADPPAEAPPPPAQSAGLDTVTIEAERLKKKELERQVSHFVDAVSPHYLHDSLTRWRKPICPLVAGLPRDQGEFVLARLSQIATTSKAPLAGEHCKPNLYIVVTAAPRALLKRWAARDKVFFSNPNGGGYFRDLIGSSRPVRVWYRTEFTDAETGSVGPNSLAPGALGTGLETLQESGIPTFNVSRATRLRRSALQVFDHVAVIVDAERVRNVSVEQLADYVAMVGLSEINPDADIAVPSVLRLFHGAEPSTDTMSAWDAAYLSSLYSIEQASVRELPQMKTSMLKKVAP
jgi:hypothetical protein